MINDKPIKTNEKQLILKSTAKLYDKITDAKKWSDVVWATTYNAKYVTSVLNKSNKPLN